MMNRLQRLRLLVGWYLQDAFHQRAVWLLACCAVAFTIGASGLLAFNFGAEEPRFLTNAARVSLMLAGIVLAALLAPVLPQGGPAGPATQLFLVRRIRREEVLFAQLGTLWIVAGWLMLVCALALATVLYVRGHAGAIAPALGLLSHGAGPLLIVNAAAVAASAIARSAPLAGLLTLGYALAGHLAPVIDHAASRAEGWEYWWWRGLDWLVADFGALQGGSASAPTVFLHSLWLFALAAIVFSRREI